MNDCAANTVLFVSYCFAHGTPSRWMLCEEGLGYCISIDSTSKEGVTNGSHVSVPVHALMIGYWALPAVQLSSLRFGG